MALLGACNSMLAQRQASGSLCCSSGPQQLIGMSSAGSARSRPTASLAGTNCASSSSGLLRPTQRLAAPLRPARQWQQQQKQKQQRPLQEQHQRGRLLIAAGGGGGNLGGHGGGPGKPLETWGQKALVGVGVTYMLLIVIIPFFNVFVQAFSHGLGPFVEVIQEPDFQQAAKMTLLLSLVAVPINTLFGVQAALFLSRNQFWGKTFAISLLDLPFSISPVITGMMFVLLYGRKGVFAPLIAQWGFPIVFAFPGMALATLFVTMPFVVRELLPILEQMDMAEEEAARSLGANDFQVFWNVTLPNIRWGLLYGIILTNARAMGEFGAISVISGNIIGQTQTLTLYVESAYKEYNSEAAFAAAVLLSFLALFTLLIKDRLETVASKETTSE